MHAHDDEPIDAALEALARPEPPADHVVRVLARTGPDQGYRPEPAGYLKARWVLPVAATVLVALGATWQVARLPGALPGVQTAGSETRPYPSWGPREIDKPVLPPQAYWGMDAFEEWNSLRPGIGSRESGIADLRPGTGSVSSEVGRGVPRRRNPTAARSAVGAGAAAQMAWVPVPSGLPPIELEPITPAPIEIAPLAALDDITVADITLAPIDIAPVDEVGRGLPFDSAQDKRPRR